MCSVELGVAQQVRLMQETAGFVDATVMGKVGQRHKVGQHQWRAVWLCHQLNGPIGKILDTGILVPGTEAASEEVSFFKDDINQVALKQVGRKKHSALIIFFWVGFH